MTRIVIVALLVSLLSGQTALGQEADKRADTVESRPAGEQPASTETVPEVDVWAEGEDAEDDVFVPTESISADSSIAFPSDI